jgi:hypothetical protein
MRGGTGAKARVIKASEMNTVENFKFNRSINPYGGVISKIKIHTNKKGRSIARIYQDTNSDGKASLKELIFYGKSRSAQYSDELINFIGSIRLKKTMHKCDWLSMKFPNTPLMCTKEYIPVVYELKLVGKSGEKHEFDGTGKFKNDFLQFYDG